MAKPDEQSFPDRHPTALLIIDVINDLEFDGGEALLPAALAMAERIAELKQRAAAAGVPAIYLNDNFGQWRSDLRDVVARASQGVRGAPLVRRLAPTEDDYFVLKPKHSGFFGTTLETLLRFLGSERLIITGLATPMCVAFTAIDAYMRDYQLLVPCDCSAAADPAEHTATIDYLRRTLKADTRPGAQIEF